MFVHSPNAGVVTGIELQNVESEADKTNTFTNAKGIYDFNYGGQGEPDHGVFEPGTGECEPVYEDVEPTSGTRGREPVYEDVEPTSGTRGHDCEHGKVGSGQRGHGREQHGYDRVQRGRGARRRQWPECPSFNCSLPEWSAVVRICSAIFAVVAILRYWNTAAMALYLTWMHITVTWRGGESDIGVLHSMEVAGTLVGCPTEIVRMQQKAEWFYFPDNRVHDRVSRNFKKCQNEGVNVEESSFLSDSVYSLEPASNVEECALQAKSVNCSRYFTWNQDNVTCSCVPTAQFRHDFWNFSRFEPNNENEDFDTLDPREEAVRLIRLETSTSATECYSHKTSSCSDSIEWSATSGECYCEAVHGSNSAPHSYEISVPRIISVPYHLSTAVLLLPVLNLNFLKEVLVWWKVPLLLVSTCPVHADPARFTWGSMILRLGVQITAYSVLSLPTLLFYNQLLGIPCTVTDIDGMYSCPSALYEELGRYPFVIWTVLKFFPIMVFSVAVLWYFLGAIASGDMEQERCVRQLLVCLAGGLILCAMLTGISGAIDYLIQIEWPLSRTVLAVLGMDLFPLLHRQHTPHEMVPVLMWTAQFDFWSFAVLLVLSPMQGEIIKYFARQPEKTAWVEACCIASFCLSSVYLWILTCLRCWEWVECCGKCISCCDDTCCDDDCLRLYCDDD